MALEPHPHPDLRSATSRPSTRDPASLARSPEYLPLCSVDRVVRIGQSGRELALNQGGWGVVLVRVAVVQNVPMSASQDNKALVRRHLEEAVNQGRPEVWIDVMAEDFVLHHPLVEPGRASYAAALAMLQGGFPDLRVEVLDLVAEDDRVVVRYIERGTHTGDFVGPANRSDLREARLRSLPNRRGTTGRSLDARG